MKIVIDQWNGCTSETCKFRKECAQHETAGNFRSEDGFSPEITVDDKGSVLCDTYEKSPHKYDSRSPSNVHELGHGMIKIPKANVFYNLRALCDMPYGAKVEFIGSTISSGFDCSIVKYKDIEYTQIADLIKSEIEVKRLVDFHKKEVHKWESLIENENLR